MVEVEYGRYVSIVHVIGFLVLLLSICLLATAKDVNAIFWGWFFLFCGIIILFVNSGWTVMKTMELEENMELFRKVMYRDFERKAPELTVGQRERQP